MPTRTIEPEPGCLYWTVLLVANVIALQKLDVSVSQVLLSVYIYPPITEFARKCSCGGGWVLAQLIAAMHALMCIDNIAYGWLGRLSLDFMELVIVDANVVVIEFTNNLCVIIHRLLRCQLPF